MPNQYYIINTNQIGVADSNSHYFDMVSLAPPTTIVTGGVTSICGDYTVHTFLSSSSLVISGDPIDVEYFVVSGGGGGDESDVAPTFCGGGGAGGVLTNEGSPISLSAGTHVTLIGAGGGEATSGGYSEFRNPDTTLIAVPVPGGAGQEATGQNGGSGGGAGYSLGSVWSGGLGTGTQGYNGGSSSSGTYDAAGGGGGYGSLGVPGIAATGAGGAGGFGTTVNPNSFCRGGLAGGGGGAGEVSAGVGRDGGGNGGVGQNAIAGTANTGGGGGGAANTGVKYLGGSGGSGIIMIKYLTSDL